MNEFPVFMYGLADGMCVPTALLNCLTAIFDPFRLPPTAVRTIYRHSLDDPQARLTSDEAIERIANEIDRLGCGGSQRGTRFQCTAEYLAGRQVTLEKDGPIANAIRREGTAMLLLCWPRSVMHAVALLGLDDRYAYFFDSKLRTHYRPKNGLTFLHTPGFVRGPNLKVDIDHLESDDPTRFYALGPVKDRQAVIFQP